MRLEVSRKARLVVIIVLLVIVLPSQVASAAGKPVKITAPGDNETVSGVYLVTGTGKGDPVEVSIDSGSWQPATGGKNWQYSWDTTTATDGPHTVNARYVGETSGDSVPVIVSNGGSARPPNVGEVLINEYLAEPSSFPNEWVELYNTTNETLDIGDMWIDDDPGASSPQQIPTNTTIAPNDRYVHNMSSNILNNSSPDSARLLSPDQATVHDSHSYSEVDADKAYCRKPDGGVFMLFQCEPTQGSSNSSSAPWQPGSLEIRVLKVGAGESQLIIGPDGRSLLLGVKEAAFNSDLGAQFVAEKIVDITGGTHVNYMMPSHWHLDHMGYAGYGGIWALLESYGITTDKIIDRNGGAWVDANSDQVCDPDNEIVWYNAGTTSGTATNWLCWVTDPTTIGGQLRELAILNSTTQIDLGIGSGVTTKIVQVDGDGVMMVDGITPIQGDHTSDPTPPSENDYSITIWINWDKFDYVTGGDSDGEYATSEFGYTYNDVESVVAARINQQVETMWVNHHGSEHSTFPPYVNTLDPAVAIFGTGPNAHGHPDQRVLDILNANGTQMYFPEQGETQGRDYYDSVIVNDDVVIRVADGVNYTVAGDPYVAGDPVTPPRQPIVGEVLVNEFMAQPRGNQDEWVELYNTTGDVLDIGGMWLDDIAGGGQAPVQIQVGTTLQPNSYYVYDFTVAYLNNDGDDVRLLSTDQATVHDAFTYASSTKNKTWCRLPDGQSWTADCNPSKGGAN